MIRRRLVVRGRVQGVFFRDGAARRAEQSEVSGWIANRSDGSVEAVLEGEVEAVEELVAWCRSGPEQASVTSVEVSEEEPRGEAGFQVR